MLNAKALVRAALLSVALSVVSSVALLPAHASAQQPAQQPAPAAAPPSAAPSAQPPAAAQPAPRPAPDEFVPVEDLPESEKLPAARFLIAAYTIVWVVLLVYVWSLWRRLNHVERELKAALKD